MPQATSLFADARARGELHDDDALEEEEAGDDDAAVNYQALVDPGLDAQILAQGEKGGADLIAKAAAAPQTTPARARARTSAPAKARARTPAPAKARVGPLPISASSRWRRPSRRMSPRACWRTRRGYFFVFGAGRVLHSAGWPGPLLLLSGNRKQRSLFKRRSLFDFFQILFFSGT